MARVSRVERWRGGVGFGIVPCRGFPVCASIAACHAPFPPPAHRTRRANFPHRALRLASPASTRRSVVASLVTPRTAQSSRMSKVSSVTAESLDGVDGLCQSPDSWSLPSWAKKAPLLIIGFSKQDLDCHSRDGRNYYLFDLGMATQIILTMTGMNLTSMWNQTIIICGVMSGELGKMGTTQCL